MKPYFLSVILIVASFQQVALEDPIEKCMQRELQVISDPLNMEAKCYRHCFQEADGNIVNGKINTTAVKENNYPFPEHLELEKNSAECLLIKASGKCELGDQLSACLKKHISNFYHKSVENKLIRMESSD